jgi:hypothetical protein
MEINRNQYFMIGLVVLLLGLQLRTVETYVLNEKASKFVAERLTPAVADGSAAFSSASIPTARRTLKPPTWAGYAVMSVGAVLVLHSLAMRRPGG